MLIRFARVRRAIGSGAFALALLCIVWLPLGVLNIVPFVLQIPGEPSVRAHASVAIGCLLVAAWGFWER